jgi:hypothetical protein
MTSAGFWRLVVLVVLGTLGILGIIWVLYVLEAPYLAPPLILVMVAVIFIVLPGYWLRETHHGPPDPFPVRVGVIALGVIVLVCIAGLFFVNLTHRR